MGLLSSPFLTGASGAPCFVDTRSIGSSYKISGVGFTVLTSRGPRPRRSAEPAAVAGTRVLSGSLVGSRGWTAAGGTRTAPIAARTAGAAAVRCARCPAGRLLPCLPAVPPLAPPRAGTRPCATLQAAPLPSPLLPASSTPPRMSTPVSSRGSLGSFPQLCSKSRLQRGPGEPCGRRMLQLSRSRSCACFLRLRSQTGFCCFRRRSYPLAFPWLFAFFLSSSIFFLTLLLPTTPSLLFPYSSFLFGQFLILYLSFCLCLA